MANTSKEPTDIHALGLTAIVTVVAIFGIIFMSTQSTAESSTVVFDSENLVGQASYPEWSYTKCYNKEVKYNYDYCENVFYSLDLDCGDFAQSRARHICGAWAEVHQIIAENEIYVEI